MTKSLIDHNETVGLIGPEYSFHDQVRIQYLPANPICYFNNFEAIFDALESKHIELAVVAINNSIHGHVENNLQMIMKNNYTVVESIDLAIQLHLATNSMIKLAEVDTIYAHPIARNECYKFIDGLKYVQYVNSHSNAQAALDVLTSLNPNSAAITNALSIKHHKLQMLRDNIHTKKPNITTFQIIKK